MLINVSTLAFNVKSPAAVFTLPCGSSSIWCANIIMRLGIRICSMLSAPHVKPLVDIEQKLQIGYRKVVANMVIAHIDDSPVFIVHFMTTLFYLCLVCIHCSRRSKLNQFKWYTFGTWSTYFICLLLTVTIPLLVNMVLWILLTRLKDSILF